MILKYPVEYKDAFGIEKCHFTADGQSLTITIRNIAFEGHFWDLSPVNNTKEEIEDHFNLEEFNYSDDSKGFKLIGYSLKVQIPIKIINAENLEVDGLIHFNSQPHSLEFEFEGTIYPFERPNFEYGLASEHTRSLHINHIKCCVNCIYSDYSPFGSDEYGDLMCFKNSKSEWLKIGYKGLKEIQNWNEVLTIERTQEAYWCDEFKTIE